MIGLHFLLLFTFFLRSGHFMPPPPLVGLKEERGREDKNTQETETKKRGRPSKLDKAESSKDYKTDSDSNTDSDIGIAKRTNGKTSSDLSDIPLKSSLKNRTQEF